MAGAVKKKRIAIVGSGVSGIGALYALKDSGNEVHLFEAQDRLGGHTNTVDFTSNDTKIPVDTGFIVLNTATYPNFIAFLKELDVETTPTDMTFGVSRDTGTFEWSGTSPASVFAQRSNIYSASFWRMIFDIIRFNQFSLDLLSTDAKAEMSIGEYLDREGYSAAFRNDYLLPMTACVWSTGPERCALDFPAITLIRFLWNHHLLNTTAARPPWMTIPGGSKRYIDAVLRAFPSAKVHLSKPVKSLANGPDNKVVLLLGSGDTELFDAVILACHGPQALEIVSLSSTPEERDILSSFTTTQNVAYLHSDTSLMPQRHLTWSSWNYITSTASSMPDHSPTSEKASLGENEVQKVTLTYNMNVLQHLPGPKPAPPAHSHPFAPDSHHILVTLNPPYKPSLTQAIIPYDHPMYTPAAIRAQSLLPTIQGTRGVYYAGAWTGYGFHEDGLRSGIEVACTKELGGEIGWKFVDARQIRGYLPSLSLTDYVLRIAILVVLIFLRVGERFLRLFTVVQCWLLDRVQLLTRRNKRRVNVKTLGKEQ